MRFDIFHPFSEIIFKIKIREKIEQYIANDFKERYNFDIHLLPNFKQIEKEYYKNIILELKKIKI